MTGRFLQTVLARFFPAPGPRTGDFIPPPPRGRFRAPLRAALVLAATLPVVPAALGADHAGPVEVGERHFVDASSNNFPPVNVLTKDGALTGFGRDMADAVIAATGGTVSHISSSRWVEVLEWLASGRADFIHDTGYAKEREAYLDYSDPILEMPERIFVNSDRFDIQRFDDLKNSSLTVACVRQHITHLYLLRFPGITCKIVERPVDGVMAIIHGEADAFIFPRQITLYLAHELLVRDRIKIVGAPLRTLAWHMTVKKGNDTMVAMLNDGIAKVRASGDYDRIYEKWFGESLFAGYSRRELRTVTGAAILISVIAAGSLMALIFAGRMRRARDRMIEAVNERERAEEELRKIEEYEHALIENSLDIITIIDAGGTIRFESPSIETLLGYEPEELVGSSALARVHPDDVGRVRDTLGQLTATPGKILSVDFRFRHKNGSWRTLESIGRNLLDHPVVAGIVVNSRDITERMELEEQLRQAQKMEAVGQLTGGVAHDFNNLLTVILGNAELMSERCADTPELHEGLASVSRAARRGASLTRRLLAFSRKQTLQPKIIDIDNLIEGMTDLIDRSMGETIELDIRTAGDPWPTEVDAAQLENVILNLAINARDAMQGGGRLVIETSNTMLDDDAAREANLPPGRYVQLAVGDSGTGMSEDVLKHVFEPFFTTKPVNRGSGLGLSMVYGFIKQSGGHVKIDTEPDHGTVVRIFLPAAADGAARAAATVGKPEVTADGHGHGETILVVEDDADVRDSVVRALSWFGYNPVPAPEAKSALAMAEARDDFDLMFTDVVLPGGVSGVELAHDMRAMRPGLKVLFTSGYMEHPSLERSRLHETDELIAKPYAIEELARRIQEMLRARAA